MRIIISPAKKMNVESDLIASKGVPVYLVDTKKLMKWVQKLDFEQVRKLWGCNEKIAELNYKRFAEMDLKKCLTAALISYEGIQYQYMAPEVFSEQEWMYVQEHLRILSGFYGVLKPFDGVTPYRLEMQAKVQLGDIRNLYDFWGDRLYREVSEGDRTIVNLASKEYSKAIEKYLQPEDTFITCVFGEYKYGKVIQKGIQAKMARGEMVRYMAEHCLEDPEQMKDFGRLGYHFCSELSEADKYVFLVQK